MSQKLLPRVCIQFFAVQNPSCWDVFKMIKIAGTLPIFSEAFIFNLVGASGHFRMIFDFMNYAMERLAPILEEQGDGPGL